MTILQMTLLFVLNRGLNHMSGKARGPTHNRATTRVDVLKYHFTLGPADSSLPLDSSSLPQRLHLIASS